MLGRHVLSVSICYEDIFPGHIRMLMSGGRFRQVPEAMFNLTDDSWYGNTVEPMEHLVLASFRAIEHRRSLIRATNTGVSAIIDPVGRIDHRIVQWTRGTLVGRVPMMQGRTVYAVLGDWMGWLCALLALLGIVNAYRLARRHLEHKKTYDGKEKKRHKRPRK
jgi:apolipoprotein N-acyltransferase